MGFETLICKESLDLAYIIPILGIVFFVQAGSVCSVSRQQRKIWLTRR